VSTVVWFGREAGRQVAALDATALDCDLREADFRALKQAQPGSLALLLAEADGDPALAAAAKAARILRKRGGGEAVVVLPPAPANPGPQALARLRRAAELTSACAILPVRASWADAVRCAVEPLAVFGLVGVDPREIHALFARPRAALLHTSAAEVVPEARDVLVSCRLRPLREVEEAARAVRDKAPTARLVLANPETPPDDGPHTLALSLL